MYTRIAITAGLTSAFLIAALAALPAHAGSNYDAFCKGSTPTPQYVCDAIKAAEKNKPAAPTAQFQAPAKASAPAPARKMLRQ